MCRSIKPLFHYDPPVTTEEVEAAALQYVRKVSGYRKPSRANEDAFNQAVAAVTEATESLLRQLVSDRPVKTRELPEYIKRA